MIYIMDMDIFGRKRIKHLESVIESLGARLDAVEKAAVVSNIELDAREMIGKINPPLTEDGQVDYPGLIRKSWEMARMWDSERKRGA